MTNTIYTWSIDVKVNGSRLENIWVRATTEDAAHKEAKRQLRLEGYRCGQSFTRDRFGK